MRTIAKLIWNMSEFTGVGLGKFAPVILGMMLGSKGEKLEEN